MKSASSESTSSMVLSIAVSLFLVSTSLAVLASAVSVSAVPTSDADSIESYESGVSKFVLKWRETQWDWPSYADDSGFVDVIISDSAFTYGTKTSESTSWESCVDAYSAYDTGLSVEISGYKEFAIGFQGFAARMSVGYLDQLLDSYPTLQAYPDLPVKMSVSSNIAQVGADQVWTYRDSYGKAVKGLGITVAVIDTGVYYNHPDLGGGFGPGHKVLGGFDFYNNDADPTDDNGHGTHVAGIIAANGGSFGVAPEASILAYKVLGADGSGKMSTVISAIEAAMDPNGDGDSSDHADIISMSLGGEGSSDDPLCLAVKSAVEAGIVVVVAAGNSGPEFGSVGSPGLSPEAITVGAVDRNDLLASFSSRGSGSDFVIKPEISAPGVSVSSTVPYSGTKWSSSTGYLPLTGTSMATPHVSGAAALVLQLHPDWSPAEVKSAIITGSKVSGNSLWQGGAGTLWIPGAANPSVVLPQPIIACGYPSGAGTAFTVESLSASAMTLTASTSDWRSLEVNGTVSVKTWTNISSFSPNPLRISALGTSEATVVVPVPSSAQSEGFYEGAMILSDGSHEIRIPFAYVLVSRLTVHLFDISGGEFIDNRGGVWVYSYPGAETRFGESNRLTATTPVSFLLPSGTYAVHALGHQLLYLYSSPYFLSKVVTLGRMQSLDVCLMMSEARPMKLNLTTDGGKPIFVIDFIMWGRCVGQPNITFDVSYVDSLIRGVSVFNLPKVRTVYVSDTAATVGIAFTGFSYSSRLWDFMVANSDHWFEYANSTYTEFRPEASADLKYLLSWEIQGIDDNTPLELGIQEGVASTYYASYDIPGSIGSIWGYSGGHMAMGADASFNLRNGAFVSVNPFFAGMTRRTVVQGVYSAWYWPGSIYGGSFEELYNEPDYRQVKKITDMPGAYLPDANYLRPIAGENEVISVGKGPFYPSVRTLNTNTSMVLIHPLLSDQSGAGVHGASVPKMSVYHDGVFFYSRDLKEFTASPSAARIATLNDPGAYLYTINCSTGFQICSQVSLNLYFVLPSYDVNPPRITGMSMPQRFVPGQSIPITLTAVDEGGLATPEISWRAGAVGNWIALPVVNLGQGSYSTSIQTKAGETSVDLRIKAKDSSGNYLEYIASNASLAQIPIIFDISVSPQSVPYKDMDVTVVLSGRLTDMNGKPLCACGGIPLELTIGGKKVATILDDYVTEDIHVHNGTIRFDWRFNPISLFDGPGKDAEVQVRFDLGTYEPITRTFKIQQQAIINAPPTIELVSPSNNSVVKAGVQIDLRIEDDGPFNATAILDGVLLSTFSSPWDIDTTSWTDGNHVLQVTAIDGYSAKTTVSYKFEIDAIPPIITIDYPKDEGRVPIGAILYATITDARLSSVYYCLDGMSVEVLAPPYRIDMSNWSIGPHTVGLTATDRVDHVTSESVSFEIINSSVVVQVESPHNGDVVRSGVPVIFSVDADRPTTNRWYDGSAWHQIGSGTTIPTDGWTEGTHSILINSTDDLGGYDQVSVAIEIDDTPPSILLVSPANNSFVDSDCSLILQVAEEHLQVTSYELWDLTCSTSSGSIVVPLDSSAQDGYFTFNVTTLDLAGNVARTSYVFAMDSSPPVISIQGVDENGAVRPGHNINLTAEDVFLSVVQWSIDQEPVQTIASSHSVDTSSLTSGWHLLRLFSSDLSGKKSWLNMSFYVDALAPMVALDEPSGFSVGTDLDVRANANDDFAVAGVFLYVEKREGGYVAIEMGLVDEAYAATVPAELVWDGMRVYVEAIDGAGNLAQSEPLLLKELLPPNGGGVPGHGSDGSFLSVLGPLMKFLPLVPMGLVSILCVVLYVRRRESDDDTVDACQTREPVLVDAISHDGSAKTEQAFERASPAVPARAAMPTQSPSLAATHRQSHQAGASQMGTKRVSLSESIPDILIKAVESSEVPGEDIDYGEFIERELNLNALRSSVFGDDSKLKEVLENIDTLCSTPRVISGLQMKKLVEP